MCGNVTDYQEVGVREGRLKRGQWDRGTEVGEEETEAGVGDGNLDVRVGGEGAFIGDVELWESGKGS